VTGARVAGLALAGLALAASRSLATADPVARPIGAVQAGGELALSGGGPRQRAGVAVTAYVTRRLGVRAALRLLPLEPVADTGVATLGVAYRAAAARPRLELVVHAEAGLAWPLAPAFGGGVTTYLWPTRWPVAVTLDLGATAIVDGVVDSRVVIATGLGLALAR
jgi:hypothetical protein